MTDFKPRTGAVVDRIRRPEPLTSLEADFAQWAKREGFAVLFSKAYPVEDDEEQFEPFDTYVLVIEEKIGDQIHAFNMTCDPTSYEPQRRVLAELLRAGFDRYKQDRGLA